MINKYAPGIRVTVAETGAGHDNIMRLRRGDVHISLNTASVAVNLAYNGLQRYEGEPFPELRALFLDSEYLMQFAALADSDIYTLRDVDGKKYSYGIPGSSAEYEAIVIFEALGVQPDQFIGGLGDAATAMKDRRIGGVYKSSAVYVLDATLADINVFTPIRLISVSEEDWAIIGPLMPGYSLFHIPAGAIMGLEEHGAVTAMGGVTYITTTAELTEELGYNITKALAEHWDQIRPAHAGFPPEPLEPFLRTLVVSESEINVLLHAGTIRYLKEIGIDVPDALIPPEYKG